VMARGGFVHGFTYSHAPAGAAVAREVLRILETEDLVEASRTKGERLQLLVRDRLADDEHVGEIRGRGLMVGIDLGEHDPALRVGQRVASEARRRGAVIRPLGNVIVLMPPLAISKGELRRLVEITAASIEAAVAGARGDEEDEPVTVEMDAVAAPLREAA